MSSLTQIILHSSARAGDANLALIMTTRMGANPRLFNELGETALMEASETGKMNVVLALAPFSDIQATNSKGFNSEALARLAGHLAVANYLATLALIQLEMAELDGSTDETLPSTKPKSL